MSAAVDAHVPSRRAPRPDPTDVVRWALIACWLVLAVVIAADGQRPSSLGDLEAGLDAGRVDTVHIAGGFPPGTTGYGPEELRWRDGWFERRTSVLQVTPGTEAPSDLTDEASAVRSGDIAAELVTRHPGVRIVREELPASGSEVLGWRVPTWVGLSSAVVGLSALALLVTGPEPWRATRWAWFWLLITPVGALGVLAFLVLSGPAPPVRPPRTGRRLPGGWAFLLCLPLGGLSSCAG